MKSLFVLSVLFILMNSMFCQAPATFEDFKKLSPEERDKLIRHPPPALQGDMYLWMARLNMGEDMWQQHQRKRLILARGFWGLEGVFDLRANIFEKFQQQKEEAAKKSGISSQDFDVLRSTNYSQVQAYRLQRNNDVESVARLAPTPEAMALSEKAEKLAGEWSTQLENSNDKDVTIKQDDLIRIEKSVKEIRNEMKTLPKCTQQQLDAAIAALPKEKR